MFCLMYQTRLEMQYVRIAFGSEKKNIKGLSVIETAWRESVA